MGIGSEEREKESLAYASGYAPQLQSALAPCQLVWHEPKFCELGDLIAKLVHP